MARVEDDPVRAKLDKAKAAYKGDVQKYWDAVAEYFDKKEAAARADGNKKLVDQIKADSEAFGKSGTLPKTAPATLGQKHAALRKAMDDSYRLAIKEYTKAKLDTEAAVVEKELEEFLALKALAPKPDSTPPAPNKPEPSPAGDGQGRVKPGDYHEIDKDGRISSEFVMAAKAVTPNILELRGGNGWVAILGYDEEAKEYRGFWEWQSFKGGRSPGGKWADYYQVRIVRLSDGSLRMDGKSKGNDFQMTYKAK